MIGRKITSGKKVVAFALTAMLTAGLFLTPHFAKNIFAMDLSGDHTLTVLPGSEDMIKQDDQLTGAAVVDVYKIATAWPDSMYETIHFTAGSDYSSLQAALDDEKSWDAAAWEQMAYDAADIALGNKTEPDCIGKSMGQAISLPTTTVTIPSDDPEVEPKTIDTSAGLYLMIVRGASTTWDDQASYVDSKADPLETVATTGQFIYSYMPQLVAVPSTHDLIEADADGNSPEIMTSDNNGNWSKAVTVRLKPGQKPALGTFKFTKQLLNCDSRQPVTCVFKIEVENPSYVTTAPYSNVVAITFKEAGEKTWPDDYIDDPELYPQLPVGAKVTITEKYEGANYYKVSEQLVSEDNTIRNDTPVEYLFVDDYNNSDKGGGSVVNTYDFIQNAGSDELTQVGDTPEQTYDDDAR